MCKEFGLKALSDINLTPTSGMVEEAKRGLAWRSEFGRGGTEVGIARARDISNGKDMSIKTVKRMFSFFSRHEVDKKAEGFKKGEDGYPSNGRIAWALWGGDAGFSWSKKKVAQIKREEEKNMCENCEKKNVDVQMKSINADMEMPNKKGEFVFTASTESTDREGDVIKADGWVLDNFKSGGVLLWGHNQDKLPVGKVLWVKQKDGQLLGKARFNGQTQLSKDVEKLVRMGDLTGISVGFRALESEKTHEGRMFTKQELLEVSVVNVPANPDAVIHTIKSLDLKSDNVKLNLYKSMETETEEKEEEEKATMDECIENKISIIMEENPEMDSEQAYAIAHEMCMDKAEIPEDEMKEPKDYIGNPCGRLDCPQYDKPEKPNKSMPELDLFLELKTRLDRIEKLLEEKENNVDKKKVEMDLRKKQTNELLRRAISKYLKDKSKNSEV
tara:strand:- start:14457 stop:15788 length:1332 start_codon:yes stop_codon:yes gene_type:complete